MMQLKSIQELADKNDVLEAKNAELTQKLDSLSTSMAGLLTWAQTQGFSGAF
jgi:cell shape-determining protein MreC